MTTPKYLFAWAIVLFVPTNVLSQSVGFIGGASIYKMTGNEWYTSRDSFNETNNYQIGHHIGVTLSIPIINDSIVRFEPGFIYTLKGNQYTRTTYYESTFPSNYYYYNREEEVSIKTHYFEFPILFKLGYYVGKINVFGNFGPYVGLGIGGKVEYNYSISYNGDEPLVEGGTDNINWHWKNGSGFNRIDIGMSYGVGVGYQSLQFRALYCEGFTEVDNVAKNRGLRLSIAYFISHKRNKKGEENNTN